MDGKIEKAFKRYEELKLAMREYEVEMKELQPVLLENLSEESPVETNNGKFTVYETVRWTQYSDRVRGLEQELKETKDAEQKTGVAQSITARTIRYTAKKR